MKKLEIVIKPEMLEDLKQILISCEVHGMMISNIMGYGNQKGYTQSYRGTAYTVNFIPKIKVETIVDDSTANKLIDTITQTFISDEIGTGKIFIYDVENTVRIRTGEQGDTAL